MAGTPGSDSGSGSGSGYPWPPYPSPSAQGNDDQRAQLEAALRAAREQRPRIAAEIGEYLYSLVLQGQLRDPIVLATCRRLYDHEQQVLQLEANLRAIAAAPPPAYTPPYGANTPPGLPPVPSSLGSEESATIIAPANLDSAETRIAPVRRPEPVAPGAGKPAERRCTHCRMPLRASDTTCPVCGRPVVEQAAESPQCRRCGTELRPQDRSCPVCGTPRT